MRATFLPIARVTVLGAAVWTHAAAQNAAREALPRDVKVAGIPGVVDAGGQWRTAWTGFDNADGIVGTPDGGVIFAQEQPGTVRKLDADDRTSVLLTSTNGTGSVSMDARGRIFGVERSCTLREDCTEPTVVGLLSPQRQPLASKFEDGRPLGRLNDLVVDRAGGAYFTSGGAYYVNPAGHVSVVASDIRANGIILSGDEQTLYVTNANVVVVFDVGVDGATTNRRDFAKLEAGGGGDGMTIDAAGRLYVTSAPGVQVFAPGGAYLGLIPTPRPVISVAFAGPRKQTLYVVGSGARDAQGVEHSERTAKTIYKLAMIAAGFSGRPK